jgi:hypothetical protein
MTIIALLDAAYDFDEIVDIILARLVAKTSDIYRPRFGFLALVGEHLGLLFREPPFVEIVVTRDEVVRRGFHAVELERGIEGVREASPRCANRRRQKGGWRRERVRKCEEIRGGGGNRLPA